MRNSALVCFFSLLLFCFFSVANLFASDKDGGSSSATVVPVEQEKLFYKISLNESFFIQEREAMINARATVEILQGDLDKVSLEVFGVGNGGGEIFNVSGEKIKDWSIRRENSRTFLEIRAKDLNGAKTFTLTISGRQPLRLPTTISPLLFSGVDSAAFFGVVQFLAPADLRLYAKQERGLIPIGERSRSEINYSVFGTPSLRLDIARANELLAPVSLEKFSLVGNVNAAGSRFRMRAKAFVREIGAEVPVLTGNAALLDLPEKNDFFILAKTDEKTGLTEYSLRFPARGEFDINLLFDAGIEDADGWQRMNFSVPVAQVAPYALKGMPSDIVFATDNVSIPQTDEQGVFSGFLPSNGTLDLRWRPSIPTPPEFSAGVYSIDAVSEMQLTTGVLTQKNELNFSISQGEIFSLFFEIAGSGDILSIEGQDLLSWRIISMEDGTRGLFVQLSQPKTGKYKLHIRSQTRAQEFPKTLCPLRFVPARVDWEKLPLSTICVRNNEFLRLRNGLGLRCEAVPQAGMTQILPSAFPQESPFFEKNVPDDEVSVYRLSSQTEKLCVKADFIRSDLVVTPRIRWIFVDGKITSVQMMNFEVRDAPLYEMHVLVPAELEMVSALDSEIVASYEMGESTEKGDYRLLKIVFSEPVLGKGRVTLTFQKTEKTPAQSTKLRACLFPQAHFVLGIMGLSGQKNIRLLSDRLENLTEIAPQDYSTENPPQLAFRMRESNWALSVRPEERPTVLSGTSSCVYKVDRKKLFGNFNVNYLTGGVPVTNVRLAFPQGAKVLSISGENIRDWSVGEDGLANIAFVSEMEDAFSVSASFEEVRENGKAQVFEGVRLLDVVGDTGSILITADNVLTLAGQESLHALATLPLGDVETSYMQRGGAILFRAYQFVERPFKLLLETHLLQEKAMPSLILSEVHVTSNAGSSCDVVCRYWTLGATELRVGVPAGMKILFAGARELPDGTTSLPLPPNASEISFRLIHSVAPAHETGETTLLLPRFFAPVVKTVFTGFGDAESKSMSVSVAGRRFNDNFNSSFFSRFFDHFKEGRYTVLIAFFTLLIALVSANVVSRKSFYRTSIVLALVAGSVFTVSMVWWLVETVSPEYGETVLFAGLIDSGTQLSVTLRRFYFLGGSDPAPSVISWFLVSVFCIGVFLLLWGAVFRQQCFGLRIVGRVLLYTISAIFAIEDFPYRISAFVATVIVIELCVFFLLVLIRVIAKFSRAGGGRLVRKAGLFIFAAGFVLLNFPVELNADEDESDPVIHALPVEDEEPRDVADRITQGIDVRGDRIVSRGDIRVSGYAGDRFDLLASPAVLTSFEKAEDAMLRLERIRAKNSGFVYQVVLERAGTFSAKFSYELALAENARGFSILSGAAAADVATIHIPRSEVQISAKDAVTTTLSALGEKSQIAQIVFKPKSVRKVQWNPRERDRSQEMLRMFATGENLYVPSAGFIEGRHVVKFVPAQGAVSRVRIQIPKTFSVSRIEGPAIHRWNFNRNSGVLTVLFTAPRTSDFSLSIFTQAPLSFLPTRQKFSALKVLDCDSQIRTIGVATGDALQVDAVYAETLTPIDEDEFMSSLHSAGMKMDPNLRLRRAFRTVNEDGDFAVELSAVQPNLRINSQEDFFINSDAVRADIRFTATVSRAEIFNLVFKIPAGIDIDAIRGDVLSYWTKVQTDDGKTRVTLHLKNALEGEQSFNIWLSGPFSPKTKEWVLPEFIVENAKIQRGEISVSVDEGLKLNPLASGVTTFTDTDSTGRSDTFRFRYYNRGGSSPKFVVLDSKPFTTANWIHRVRPLGRYAFSQLDMIFDIENVMRSSVHIGIPENALSVRFFGDDLVSAKKIDDEANLWELKFSKPIRGKVSVSAEFFTPLPTANLSKIRPIVVKDTDRQSAWLAVERGNVFTALRSHSPEKASVNDVPEDLRSRLVGREWFVEKYAEKYISDVSISSTAVAAWTESLTDAHRDSFSAESLDRYTVFGEKMALTEERISLRARRSDVLRITLPEGGVLKAVSLNGTPAEVVPVPEVDIYSVWLPVFAQNSAIIEVSVLYEHPLQSTSRGERKVLEIIPAEIIVADKMSWSLVPFEKPAEILSVFGRSPEKIRVAQNRGARLLDAYFESDEDEKQKRESKSFSEAASEKLWQTFLIEGKDNLKSRAVVAFNPTNHGSPGSDFDFFLTLLFALILAKIILFLNAKKKTRQ